MSDIVEKVAYDLTCKISDPYERMLARYLERYGVEYEHKIENGPKAAAKGFDFYLPFYDTYIQFNQFHSDDISKQMSRADNVVVIQGLWAAVSFCQMIAAKEAKK